VRKKVEKKEEENMKNRTVGKYKNI